MSTSSTGLVHGLSKLYSKILKMSKKSFGEYLSDFTRNLILGLFYIYSKIHTVILLAFFPLTKYLVDKRLAGLGVTVGGNKDTDIKVLNPRRFYTRVAIERSYGLLDSKLDGDWETRNFRGFVGLIFSSRRHSEVVHPLYWTFNMFNLQTKAKAFEVGKEHYDDANPIIEAMIDTNLQYSCGYWKNATNLDEAQIAKMDLIARKLNLKPGMTVIDLGCGYGTFGIYLATHYKVSVVGCSVSVEQINYGKKKCKELGLSNCEFVLCDYRDMTGKFDRVVSVGFFEHIGVKNYDNFFKLCRNLLKDDGIFLLHTIGNLLNSICPKDFWLDKYIFRNSYCPHYLQVCKAIEDLWIIEDWQNMGYDYAKTIAEWEKNFDKTWPTFEKQYGKRFHTMWKMYLQGAIAMFETRSLHLWQLVLSKDGIKGGYHAAR